jgi:molecular chaperone DnaK
VSDSSDTIDFGIDLGTTNSAIAVFRRGEVSVIKNNDGWDYTPSAVWMPRPGARVVGRKAREHAERDPDNAQAEFKQEMGLDVTRTFRDGRATMTPPELSAEVLKSLRADAAHQYGEPPPAAVITVPAAFRLHQNNATGEAATLAGFGACPLVQEPTAAAFAHGLQEGGEDSYWMVFDFGGGTFDSAVVNKQDGELRVLDHAGDPYLGGKLIDWAIVERRLAPAVAKEYALSGFTRDNPAWQLNFARLKIAAEEGKIAVSRTASHGLEVELELPDGRSERFWYELTRDEVDLVAEPYYVRAINLCRKALEEADLRPADIDRLLLVGGVTLTPGLRERLADPKHGLGITLDHSLDPRTVVAVGAAVFASTVPLDRPRPRPAAGEFGVDLRYPRTTSELTVPVAGRFLSDTDTDWPRHSVVLENPKGRPPFRTPQVSLDASGGFVTEVRVDADGASTFTVLLSDGTGAPRKVVPDSFPITHLPFEPGGQVLTNSIGLAEADRSFAPILRKGARLPATARGTFYTTVALHRTDSDAVIRIPIVEGERDRADRNLQVGLIEIRPKDVRIDLPQGSDVEVTIEVDESRRVTVVADVPLVDAQFESEIDLADVRPPDPAALEAQLREAQGRLGQLRDSADRSGSDRAQERLDRLDEEQRILQARGEVRAAPGNASSAAAADEQIRDIQAVLDEVEKDLQVPAKLAELATELESCREMVNRLGEAEDRTELADIERRAEQQRRDPDAAAIDQLIDRTVDLITVQMRRDGTYDVAVFYYYRENQHKLTSPVRTRALIAEGEEAIANKDWRSLPGINQRLRRLLPAEVPDPARGGVVRQRATL